MTEEIFSTQPLSPEYTLLRELYERTGRTLDDLPYTDEFDQLYAAFSLKQPGRDKRYVIDRLFRLRKAGLLPRLGYTPSAPIPMTDDEIATIEALVRKYVTTLGQRDQLPYTPEFDKLVAEFNKQRPSPALEPHAVWRLVARVAK